MRKRSAGYIYLVHAIGTNLYKIGFAINPAKRIKDLSTASPFALKMLASREGSGTMEQQMHRCLKEYRVRGEWFEFTDEDFIVSIFNSWTPMWEDYMDYEVTWEDHLRCTAIMDYILRDRRVSV